MEGQADSPRRTSEGQNPRKTPEISLYFTFYHFFSDAEVKVDKETAGFLSVFDRLKSKVFGLLPIACRGTLSRSIWPQFRSER